MTAHPTQVGLTRDLFAAKQDLAGIKLALRWKSLAQPVCYAGALAVDASAKMVGEYDRKLSDVD